MKRQSAFTNITVIALIVIIFGVISYFGLAKKQDHQTTPPVGPNISTTKSTPDTSSSQPQSRTVNLGEEFTLKKDESAHLKNTDVYLTLTSFVNSPCPPGAVCVWSGQAVNYELRVGSKIYEGSTINPISEFSYSVLLRGSDYQTFAVFVIELRRSD